MKNLPLLILLLGIVGISHAQLQTNYVNSYRDGFVDSLFRTGDVVALSNGDFGITARLNLPGEDRFSIGVFRLDIDGNILGSFTANTNNETALSPFLSEGVDGSLWVAAQIRNTDEDELENIRIMKFSADLSMVEMDEELDFLPQREQLYGFSAIDDKLILVVSGQELNETTGFLERNFFLYSLEMTDLSIANEVDEVYPRNSFTSGQRINIRSLGENTDRFAVMMTVFNPENESVNDILNISEFAISDLTLLEEYEIPGISTESYSPDIEYVPALDAYAATNGSFNTFLINRGTAPTPVIDTVMVPDGIFGSGFRNTIAIGDTSIYLLARDAYQIGLSNGAVSSVSPFENFSTSFSDKVQISTTESTIMVVNSTNQNNAPARGITYTLEDATFQDTVILKDMAAGLGISTYWGCFAFPAQGDDSNPLIGLKQSGRFLENSNTFSWGFSMIDAETGDRTGQTLSTADFSFWDDTQSSHPELNPLVRVGNGYLVSINEGVRITYFRYNSELEALQPEDVSFGAAEFDLSPFLLGNRITKVAPTSYGMIGTTFGSVNTAEGNFYLPHIFAADTLFQNRIVEQYDTVQYYPFGSLVISVDGSDQFYTAGITAIPENQFTQSDSIAITGYDSNGVIRYISYVQLPGNSFGSTQKIVLNDTEDELLISGNYSDTLSTNYGFLIKVDPADGTIKESTFFSPDALGYGPGERLNNHWALYDAAGNIVQALVEARFTLSSEDGYTLRVLQTTPDGEVLADKTVFSTAFNFIDIQNFNRIGESLIISGTEGTAAGIEQQTYLAHLLTGTLVNTEEPLTNEIASTLFPNPTSGRVTLRWKQPDNSDYQVQLMDYSGRVMRTWRGNQPAGSAQLELQINELPNGTYFLRLDTQGGYMIKPVVKMQ